LSIRIGDVFFDWRNGDAWLVQGVHLGAEKQENLIEVSALGVSIGSAYGEKTHGFVPLRIFELAVKHGAIWHTRFVPTKEDQSEGEGL
jgi:hypothetical protein